jgi:hypothetical protein
MTQPAPGLTGTCANCNWLDGHDARCPTLTHQETLRTFVCAHCGAAGSQPTHRTDSPLSDRGYVGRHRAPGLGLRDELAVTKAKELAGQMHAWLFSPLGTDALDLPLWSSRAYHALRELTRDA